MDVNMIVVAALIFAGCFAKIIMIFLYNKLVEDSFCIADCSSELIKQIKLRYTNQIKLELPIQDVGKFVSRYIYQYSKIIKTVNVMDMLSLILMLAGIALNYEKKYFSVEVLLVAIFIYLAVGLLVDGDKKERIVINNIADYLVNNMNIRMTAKEHRVQVKESLMASEGQENMMDSEGLEKESVEEDGAQSKSVEEIAVNKKIKQNSMVMLQRGAAIDGLCKEDNAIIEEVLREFLQA